MVHPPTFRASLRQCLNMNILKTGLENKKNTHIFNKIIWRVIWKLHSFVLFQYNLSFLLNPA